MFVPPPKDRFAALPQEAESPGRHPIIGVPEDENRRRVRRSARGVGVSRRADGLTGDDGLTGLADRLTGLPAYWRMLLLAHVSTRLAGSHPGGRVARFTG